MNDQGNMKNQLTDDKRLPDRLQQPADELVEIEVDRLEEVSGAGDGTAIGLGKN